MIEAERRKTFPYNASVEIVAGAGIVPGGIVEISGYKSNIDGLWYVKSVRHNIGGTTYTTELELGKDRNTQSIFTTAPTTLSTNPPEAVFVDNEWRASQDKVVLYA